MGGADDVARDGHSFAAAKVRTSFSQLRPSALSGAAGDPIAHEQDLQRGRCLAVRGADPCPRRLYMSYQRLDQRILRLADQDQPERSCALPVHQRDMEKVRRRLVRVVSSPKSDSYSTSVAAAVTPSAFTRRSRIRVFRPS